MVINLKESATDSKTANEQQFSGKIAVVTSPLSVSEDDFHSAEHLAAKYGKEKIIHVTWPANLVTDRGQMMDIVANLAIDREIKIIIFNQTYVGTNVAVDRLRETRDDMFIVYCVAHETTDEAVKRANLILAVDDVGMGTAMVKQARKQGAKIFVHYSFPRHMSIPRLKNRRDIIQKECSKESIQFVDVTVPDPVEGSGFSGATQFVFAQQFITNDVKKLVAQYGDETAFFCSNCSLQAVLIKAVVESHTIYPQPCCPSPFHGFPEALGIETSGGQVDLNHVISEASRIAAEKNMTDRLSTWPVSAHTMFTNAGVEYAIKWINGEVPKDRINDSVLEDCMNAYIREVVGEGVEVTMEPYKENGSTWDNYKMMLMSYLDF